MTGYGRYSMPNGRVYEGDWKNGKMHGDGKFKWEDGRIYQGNLKKENTLWIKDMEMEHLSGQMEEFTKDNGSMIKDMAKLYIKIDKIKHIHFYGETIR